MTRCEVPFEMLSAYVDGQLETDDHLQVRRHLDRCTGCHERVQRLSALNQALASTTEVHPVPHALRERVNQMRAPDRATTRFWGVAAIAAVLAVGFVVTHWNRPSNVNAIDELAQALLEDHMRYLNIPDAIQVASDDPRRIADSFSDRVGFPIQLPRLNDASLLGARFCWLKHNRALLSFYQSHGRRFSVFAMNQSALPPNAVKKARCTSSGKYEVCLLPAGPELLAMVGEREQTKAIFPEFGRLGAAPSQRPGTESDANHSE